MAARFAAEGADRIDLGCDPDGPWDGVGDAVKALRDCGHRVSIDSFDPAEVARATASGADLVLSVNATNRAHAADWGVEVVVIPDRPGTLDGLDETVEYLTTRGIPFRIDQSWSRSASASRPASAATSTPAGAIPTPPC